MDFHTTVKGIPCTCKVLHYYPGMPMTIHGSGFGDAHPPEEVEFVYEIYDKKGYKAPWLEAKIDTGIERRLLREYHAFLQYNPLNNPVF